MGFLYRRSVLTALSVLLLLAACILAAVIYWKKQLNRPLDLSQDVIYELPSGKGASQTLSDLQRQGIIKQRWPLRIWFKLYPEKALLKAGEYRLPEGINAYELVAILSSGQSIQYQITLPEGLTFRQALAILQQHPKLDIQTQNMSVQQIMSAVAGPTKANLHPEGLFFPDTYQFHKGVSDIQLLKTAYQKMDRTLTEAWKSTPRKKLPYKSAYEALIMASIVEKETGVPEERGRIAGVFVSRLEKRMRLQTDPTVIYGLGERYDGNLTRAHLREKTAYNTYRINGLPPTPIALPGKEAILAALNPEQDGALYFVAKGDGSHAFNRTLAAHNRAVREYQIYKRKKNYQSSPTKP